MSTTPLVPLPYIALCAWILARRSRERHDMPMPSSSACSGRCSTIVVDVLAARLLQGLSWRLAAVHFRFWDGYLFALVPLAQLVAPAIALRVLRQHVYCLSRVSVPLTMRGLEVSPERWKIRLI